MTKGRILNPALLAPLFLTLLLTLVLAGCVSQEPTEESYPPGTVLVWPPAPAPERIGYVSQFSTARDLGIRGGALTWLQRLLFGNAQISLVKPMAVLRDGDMVITMGAGDIYRAGEMLLEKLSGAGST